MFIVKHSHVHMDVKRLQMVTSLLQSSWFVNANIDLIFLEVCMPAGLMLSHFDVMIKVLRVHKTLS